MATRVLIVEDDDSNADIIIRRLQRAGYDCTLATTGNQALRLMADRPDIVLLDMMLPDHPGWELVGRWKAAPAVQDVPIIGLSAMALQHDIDRGIDAGCDSYVTKPIDWTLLFGEMSRLLDEAGA